MNIKEYRAIKGLTQPELAKELRVICEGIDAPLISKMEKGLCLPPEEVQLYIDAQEAKAKDETQDLTESQFLIYARLDQCRSWRPVTRQELSLLTGNSDREVRRDLEEMRRQGIRICSGGEGYWIAYTEEDYKAYRARELKRAKSILKTISAMDRYTEGQVRM